MFHLLIISYVSLTFFAATAAKQQSRSKMASLFQDESSADDATFNADEEAGEVAEEDAEEEEIDEKEAEELKRDLKSPVTFNLGRAFAGMSIGTPKMVAIVEDGGKMKSPYPLIHLEWKDHERQRRLSLACNMPSGTIADDIAPVILPGRRKISITKKWSKQLFQVNKVLGIKF